jgi:hypothetical protein
MSNPKEIAKELLEVLIGDNWEPVSSVDELKEAFFQYHKNWSPKREIMIIS